MAIILTDSGIVIDIRFTQLAKDKLPIYVTSLGSLILDKVKTQLTVKCKCGHSVIIPVYENKKLCTYCNKWVYNNTPMRFKYYFRKLKEGEKDE